MSGDVPVLPRKLLENIWLVAALAYGLSSLAIGRTWLVMIISSAIMVVSAIRPFNPSPVRWRAGLGLVCFVIALICGRAEAQTAQDVAQQSRVIGPGALTCAASRQAGTDKRRNRTAIDWTEGFVSYYDTSAAAQWGRDKSGEALLIMVDADCAAHPQALFIDSAAHMVNSLIHATDAQATVPVPPAHAAGIGALNCTRWRMASKRDAQREAALAWLSGYISGYNFDTGGQWGEGETAPDNMLGDVDAFCAGHPETRFAEAAEISFGQKLPAPQPVTAEEAVKHMQPTPATSQ